MGPHTHNEFQNLHLFIFTLLVYSEFGEHDSLLFLASWTIGQFSILFSLTYIDMLEPTCINIIAPKYMHPEIEELVALRFSVVTFKKQELSLLQRVKEFNQNRWSEKHNPYIPKTRSAWKCFFFSERIPKNINEQVKKKKVSLRRAILNYACF